VDASYFDPAAVINVPGTETSVGLHGFAQFQIIHDTNGPAGNQFDTAFIPVEGAPSETKFNVNPSRIAVSSVTPVSDGQLNTMISMDFNGQVDHPDPRLRLAYGEFVNERLGFGVLGGQTFATMADLRAVPETVDFAVPAGSWAQRQPLLRLTKAFRDGFLLESSIETPQNVRYIDAEKRTRLPDVVLTGTWISNGDYLSHFRLGALGRDLRARAANGATDSALGWAVAASAKVDLPFLGKRDNIEDLIGISDLLLLPSENESFGLVALEAMACEVPVVVSKVGGLTEVITDGAEGYLVPPGEVDTMADRAYYILSDTDRRREMGRRGRENARARFCSNDIIKQYEEYYAQILSAPC